MNPISVNNNEGQCENFSLLRYRAIEKMVWTQTEFRVLACHAWPALVAVLALFGCVLAAFAVPTLCIWYLAEDSSMRREAGTVKHKAPIVKRNNKA